jgi:ATP-dependent RNA helicase DeaD
VFDPGQGLPARERRDPREPRQPREPRGERESRPSVWFRLNIGRQKNADPRWLIPLICRQGKITKQEIGAIRILERETRFEIDATFADKFLAATRQIERPEGRIEPLGDAPQGEPDHGRRDKPHSGPARGKPAWKAKAVKDRPQ